MKVLIEVFLVWEKGGKPIMFDLLRLRIFWKWTIWVLASSVATFQNSHSLTFVWVATEGWVGQRGDRDGLDRRGWVGLRAVKDLHKLCPCCSCCCCVAPAVKIRIFLSNSNSPLNEYLCYRFWDSSFYFVPKSRKNLRRVHCQAIERDVAIRPKCPHKTVAKKVRNSWTVWDETVASFTFLLHATSNQDQSGLLCQNGNCKTDISQQTGVCTAPSTRLHPLHKTLFLIWGKLCLHEWT